MGEKNLNTFYSFVHDCKTLKVLQQDDRVYKLADRIECGLELQLVLKYDKIWPIDEILQNPNPIKNEKLFWHSKMYQKILCVKAILKM